MLLEVRTAVKSPILLWKVKIILMLGYIQLGIRWLMRQIKRSISAPLSLRYLKMTIRFSNYKKINYHQDLMKKMRMKNKFYTYLNWHRIWSLTVIKKACYCLCQRLLVKIWRTKFRLKYIWVKLITFWITINMIENLSLKKVSQFMKKESSKSRSSL